MARRTLKKRPRKRVALLIETSNAYGRGLLRGIRSFVRENSQWSTFLIESGRGQASPEWVTRFKGDGIIARIETPDIAAAVTATGLPVVDVSAARLIESLPWVETDDRAIAELAMNHLTERGFKRLAYCGDDRFNWSRWRGDHFTKLTQQAGHKCAVLNTPAEALDPDRELAVLTEWLQSLEKPVGIMACYDIRGRQILDACRAADIAVPDDVAVLGVDNDQLLCDLTDPTLSSIVPDTHKAGYLAASTLAKLMARRRVAPGSGQLVEPRGVVTRRSTDGLAIEDAEVSAAMRFIREHACEGINVEDVLAQVPLSRRVLEARFKRAINRSPHQQIVRLQLQRAKQLLAETRLPLSQIAAACGFRHAEYLSVVFKKYEGVPPSHYRSAHGVS